MLPGRKSVLINLSLIILMNPILAPQTQYISPDSLLVVSSRPQTQWCVTAALPPRVPGDAGLNPVSGLASFPLTYAGRCRKSSLASGSGHQQAAPLSTSLVAKNPPAEVIRPTSSQQRGALTSRCLVQVATPPQWRAQQSVAPSTMKGSQGGPSLRRRSHGQDQVGGKVGHGTNSPRFRVQ